MFKIYYPESKNGSRFGGNIVPKPQKNLVKRCFIVCYTALWVGLLKLCVVES